MLQKMQNRINSISKGKHGKEQLNTRNYIKTLDSLNKKKSKSDNHSSAKYSHQVKKPNKPSGVIYQTTKIKTQGHAEFKSKSKKNLS